LLMELICKEQQPHCLMIWVLKAFIMEEINLV
jgi:hypothetical protein